MIAADTRNQFLQRKAHAVHTVSNPVPIDFTSPITPEE